MLMKLARINPHTGASFPDVPPPQVRDLDVLRSDFRPWQIALSYVAQIGEAFKEYSQRFEIGLSDITPMMGDCKLVHVSTGREIVIEIKAGHCNIKGGIERRDGSIDHLVYGRGVRGRMIFSWKVEWTYLFTTVYHAGRDTGLALFVPRDSIPMSWWNEDPSTGHPEQRPVVQWSEDERFHWQDFIVSLTDPKHLVQDMEKILANNEWDPHNSIPVAPLPLHMLGDVLGNAPSAEEIIDEEVPAPSDAERNPHHQQTMIGRFKHHWSNELLSSHVFLRMCRAR